MKKTAVLSMDVEEWYHLDYIRELSNSPNYSMMDGLHRYIDLLDRFKLTSSFFVLGEIAYDLRKTLNLINDKGHDIGSHGWDHKRPLNMSLKDFKHDIVKSKNMLENIIGKEIIGYRAPCFSLDRKRLNIIYESGYKYDSSRIDFGLHPLYGKINMDGFENYSKNIYMKDNFFEFEVSTTKFINKNIPISGGGYLRILPWFFTNSLLQNYLSNNELYVFYIHPFEFSKKKSPSLNNISIFNQYRFSRGRLSVYNKMVNLIDLLNDNSFHFTNFADLRKTILNK